MAQLNYSITNNQCKSFFKSGLLGHEIGGQTGVIFRCPRSSVLNYVGAFDSVYFGIGEAWRSVTGCVALARVNRWVLWIT